MDNQKIYDAITPIVTGVADAVGAAVVWPGWAESKNKPYFAVKVMPAEPDPFGLSRIDNMAGVIMMSYRELAGKGARGGRAAASAMAAAFPRGMRIELGNSVMLINRAPSMPAELQEAGMVAYPINVRFIILNC